MILFPTQYSTLSSSALARFIAEQYGMAPLTCRLLLRNVSDTYELTDPDGIRSIFKVYRTDHRSYAEIEEEVTLLVRLRAHGLSVSAPLPDRSGAFIQAFQAAEGVRYGVLFTYAGGENVYDLSDAQLRALGREMAGFHAVPAPEGTCRLAYTEETTLFGPLERIRPAFEGYEEGYAYLSETAAAVSERLRRWNTAQFSFGYCQFDFLPKNFHFAGDTITFFDFDFAGKGFQVLDLTTFFVHFFFHEAHGKITREEGDRQFTVFLNAYREVRPLTDEEIAAIPYLFPMFWLFYLGFQYDNRGDCTHSLFNARFLRDRVEAVKRFRAMYWNE
ncbi:MAG: phosphotransferase [Siphonobacter aquaeclarae]|nr:phosphotransferase [Siphonobacter aquaeclarae]